MAKILEFPYEWPEDATRQSLPNGRKGPATLYSFDSFDNYRMFRLSTERRAPRSGIISNVIGTAAAVLISMGPAYCKMPFVRSRTAEEQLLPVFAYAAGKS